MDLLRTLASRNPNARLPVGLEEALVGIGTRDGRAVAIYDEARCIALLRASLSESEARASLEAIRSIGGQGAPYFASFAPSDNPLPSDSVRAILGMVTEDTAQPPMLAWATGQMRSGSLRPAVDRFVVQNPQCDPRTVVAEALTSHSVIGRFPVCLKDHESPSPFRADVRFVLDLASQEISAHES